MWSYTIPYMFTGVAFSFCKSGFTVNMILQLFFYFTMYLGYFSTSLYVYIP